MKLVSILLLVQVVTVVTVVKAQRNSNLSNQKPVVDLKKQIIQATRKLPEERRKLSIFPKNTQKFVVTSPPYSKVRKYTPRPIIMTKKPFMPLLKPSITREDPVTTYTSLRSFNSVVNWPTKVLDSRIHRRIVEEEHVNNKRGYKMMPQDKENEEENQIEDDSEEISTDLPEFADELTKEFDNNVLVDFNTLSELDSVRAKRFIHDPISVHDSWYFKNVARVPNDISHMEYDEDEFIFVDDKKKPSNSVLSNKSSKSIKNSSVENTSPSTAQSMHMSSRPKRSNNVIEEEDRVTNKPRFSVGHEAQLNSDLVFKNIHT